MAIADRWVGAHDAAGALRTEQGGAQAQAGRRRAAQASDVRMRLRPARACRTGHSGSSCKRGHQDACIRSHTGQGLTSSVGTKPTPSLTAGRHRARRREEEGQRAAAAAAHARLRAPLPLLFGRCCSTTVRLSLLPSSSQLRTHASTPLTQCQSKQALGPSLPPLPGILSLSLLSRL